MSIATQMPKSMVTNKFDEMILVVKRTALFCDGDWQGLKTTDFEKYQTRIIVHQEYHPRGLMEEEPAFKQIIPYLVFRHQGRIFVMQRSGNASEQRLQNRYTIGIGGHVRQEDLINAGSVFDWAQREFHEEVSYTGNITIKPLGILNDDSNPVGKVHVGLVLLLEGDSADICIKSELKSGLLQTVSQCMSQYDCLESWSQHIIKIL